MNKASTDKITSATPFLMWFRRYMPAHLQARIRPYLDQPYRLAFIVLDCCNATRPLKVGEIAQAAGVTYSTASQVLQALKEGGMPFVLSPARSWQPVEVTPLVPDSRTSEPDVHSAETILVMFPSPPDSNSFTQAPEFRDLRYDLSNSNSASD